MAELSERERAKRAVSALVLAPLALVVMPSLLALELRRSEEASLMSFVLTRPFVPTLIVVYLLIFRRVQKMLNPPESDLAAETGARSGSETAVLSYLGVFVPFVVFCGLSAACAMVNATGAQSDTAVIGQVERVNFGRWTRSYSVTLRQSNHTEITLPIKSSDAVGLRPGSAFSKAYRRGKLGILYLP